MTDIEQKLLRALVACRDRFAFYVVHHCHKGDLDKASENNKFVERADAAIDAARQAEPLNFCSRCGRRLTPEGVHTCTPPMGRDAELEQARAEEREACVAIIQDAATAAANNNDLRGYELLSALGRAIRARGEKP